MIDDLGLTLRGLTNALCSHALPALAQKSGDLTPFLPAIADDLRRQFGGEQALRQALERLAEIPHNQLREAVHQAVDDVAADQPDDVRQALALYLEQVTRTVRVSALDRTATLTRSHGRTPDDDDAATLLFPRRTPRFSPGDQPHGVGDWVLDQLLGAGGFGEVWRARHAHFDGIAPVALKFCLDAAARDRLLRHEAGVLNQVMRSGMHPGVVQLIDAFLSNDPPCLKYEYVSGGDLSELTTSWPAPPDPRRVRLATYAVRDLATTIGHMHRLVPPVIHRDLKPGNVLVQPMPGGEPRLRIADFGIGGIGGSSSLEESGLRRSHTPLYASPQQKAGETPVPTDDLHALGVIWFQLLIADFHTSPTILPPAEWQAKLREAGTAEELITLVSSCVSADASARPADGTALAELIDAALAPTEDDGPVTGYRIVAPIPAPGPALLYQAERRVDQRTVALKVLSLPSPGGPETVTAFRHEAEILTQLEHPHIIQALDFGEQNGVLFLVMEYIAGSTLDRICRTGPQPISDAVKLIEELARATGYLHGRGLVHRDLRPAAVLLQMGPAGCEGPGRPYGSPRLIDFVRTGPIGVAAPKSGGTPAYLAPELLSDRQESHPQVDVWALGVMLYELLTGRVPFQGRTLQETIEQVRAAEPEPLRRLRPEVPPALAAVVTRALAKQPAERYPDGNALAEALASCCLSGPTSWWGRLFGG